MTTLDKAEPVQTGMTGAGRSPSVTEFIETIRLALPIALTQLGQIAMMTTDLALIGRLGDRAVAAASLALMGLMLGILVLITYWPALSLALVK